MSRDALRAQLMADEGFRASAYRDSLGYLTIGYGRLIDARKGGGISRAEAAVLLDHDLERVERDLRARFPWFATLDPVRQDVLINMGFNLGVPGLAQFTGTLGHVSAGRYREAADAMLDSRWAQQVGARAQRLAALMRG